jgi:hypothetical protein
MDNHAESHMERSPSLVLHLQCAPHIPKALTDYRTNGFWRIGVLSIPECGHPSKPAIPLTRSQPVKVDLPYKGGCHPRFDMDPTHLSSPARREAIAQGYYTVDANYCLPRFDHLVQQGGNPVLLRQVTFPLQIKTGRS